MQLEAFTFNPFQENTYVLYDETKDCVIIDPGCYTVEEKQQLTDFIKKKDLHPVKLLNTHCHVDHILGNLYVATTFGLTLETNELELPLLQAAPVYASGWGINVEKSPEPSVFLQEGDTVRFGNTKLDVLFVPGHSPGSICFYNKESKILIVGDVLFNMSIGRTDLPGGDYNTLIDNIKQKLLKLEDNVKVFPGHGPSTTIGFERLNNPFLN